MRKQKISVTYAVTFSRPVTNGNRTYPAGKEHAFKTQSPTSHPGDMFDSAYDAIHRLFGCIKQGSYERLLPLSVDPIIKSWKECEK